MQVICPCGCGKMIPKALYKTGAAWHAQRNSKEAMQQKAKAKLQVKEKEKARATVAKSK